MAERITNEQELIGGTSLDVFRHVVSTQEDLNSLNICTFNEHYIGGWNKSENAYIPLEEISFDDPFSTIRRDYVSGCKFGFFSESSEPDDDGGYLHFQMLEFDIPKSEQAVTQITDMVKNNRLFYHHNWLLETDKSYQLIGPELIGVNEIYTLMGYLLAEHRGLLSDNAIAAILKNHGTAIRISGVDFPDLSSKVIKLI
jgi:hypothetical protein